MKLDLSEIARVPGSYAEHEIDITLQNLDEMILTDAVRGILHISSTGRVLLLTGSIDTVIELICSRCGTTYSQPTHAEIEEDFIIHPPQSRHSGPRIEEEEAPEARLFFPGTLDLNLDELLRQTILISLPLKPLCSEDCPGLCPNCGQKFSVSGGKCNCQQESGHPQLMNLQKILEHKTK